MTRVFSPTMTTETNKCLLFLREKSSIFQTGYLITDLTPRQTEAIKNKAVGIPGRYSKGNPRAETAFTEKGSFPFFSKTNMGDRYLPFWST